MSEACLKQIRYWSAALRQANKAIRRKNRHIYRLQCENAKLSREIMQLHEEMAEDLIPEKQTGENRNE